MIPKEKYQIPTEVESVEELMKWKSVIDSKFNKSMVDIIRNMEEELYEEKTIITHEIKTIDVIEIKENETIRKFNSVNDLINYREKVQDISDELKEYIDNLIIKLLK